MQGFMPPVLAIARALSRAFGTTGREQPQRASILKKVVLLLIILCLGSAVRLRRACRRHRWPFASPALRIVRSPVGAVLRAIRDNPLRAAAVGHDIRGYKLTAYTGGENGLPNFYGETAANAIGPVLMKQFGRVNDHSKNAGGKPGAGRAHGREPTL
jgi:hypothetical protein